MHKNKKYEQPTDKRRHRAAREEIVDGSFTSRKQAHTHKKVRDEGRAH